MKQIRLDTIGKLLKPTRTTGGRKKRQDDDNYLFSIDPFLLDKSKILQSKGLRRLAEKTQVHSLPFNPHIRTRLTHTFEVTAISASVACILGLNTILCEAIALGHDIGHTPYGHAGEEVLEINHAINSAVVLQELERKGNGLNLTKEVVDGIISHSRAGSALVIDKRKSSEINLIVYVDKIAYTFSDFNDFKRLGWLKNKDVPEIILKLGDGINAQRKRIETCIEALIEESLEKGTISFLESEVAQNFNEIRNWMYKKMYLPIDWGLQKENLQIIIEYFEGDGSEFCENLHPNFVVSLLTDREANWFSKILRTRKPTKEEVNMLSMMEIIPSLKGKEIDHTKYYELW